MIRLIGLAGAARSGKSSAAKFLCEQLPFTPYALASPIKHMINALFGWDDRHTDGDLKEQVVEVNINRTAFMEAWDELRMNEILGPGSMSQSIFNDMIELLFQDGLHSTTESGEVTNRPAISPRRAYQLFGTEFGRGQKPTVWLDMAKRKLNELEDGEGLVITDIRFPNEHQWVSQNGGFVVHVRRAGKGFSIKSDHESEEGLVTMAMDWQTPFCENLEVLEASISRVAQFAAFATTTDVSLSGRMPSFQDVYGDRLYG